MSQPAATARRAAELLAKHDQTAPPINVEMIAQREGATILYETLGRDVSGVLLRNGNQTLLGVNRAHSPRRQRFTIAHEIAHLVLHPGRQYTVDSTVRLNWRDDLSSLATNREEIAANAFAAALLMPEPLVRQAVNGLGHARVPSQSHVVELLAKQFDVSSEAMSFRLINLGITS